MVAAAAIRPTLHEEAGALLVLVPVLLLRRPTFCPSVVQAPNGGACDVESLMF